MDKGVDGFDECFEEDQNQTTTGWDDSLRWKNRARITSDRQSERTREGRARGQGPGGAICEPALDLFLKRNLERVEPRKALWQRRRLRDYDLD